MGCVASNILCNPTINKCIGDDTKAAARQSLNCIKNQKIWLKTIFNMPDGILTPCNVARSRHWFRQVTALSNVACGSGIVTVNSPSGSTLRGSGMTCQWMCPNVRHIGILHMVSISTHHRSRHVICTSLRNFIQIWPPSTEKNASCRFSRWRISAILDCLGSNNGFFEKPS